MIQLDDWQKEIKAYDGDKLLCTGRRVGKTEVLAENAIDYMAAHPNTPIVIISLTEDQAMLIMAFALNYAKEAYPKLLGRGKHRPIATALHLNGGRMIIRPVGNKGEGIRGYEGGVLIVDEAARMPKSFWIAALPVIATAEHGQIWMSSTLFGTDNYFYERFEEAWLKKKPDARFKAWVVTTEGVAANRPISASWTGNQRANLLRILAESRKEMTKAQYAQEYLAIADVNLKQLFSDELIKKCMVIQRPSGSLTTPDMALGDIYLGGDLAAQGSDQTVLISVRRSEDKERISMIDMKITTKSFIPDTIAEIKLLHRIYNYKKIYLDSGGLGVGITHPLMLELPNKIVEINNAKRSLDRDDKIKRPLDKETKYANLKRLMECGYMELFDEEDIWLSLKSVQYEYTETELKIFGRYTHIAEALANSAWCVQEKSLNLWAG